MADVIVAAGIDISLEPGNADFCDTFLFSTFFYFLVWGFFFVSVTLTGARNIRCFPLIVRHLAVFCSLYCPVPMDAGP